MQTTSDAPSVRIAHLPPYDALDFDSLEGAFSKVMHLCDSSISTENALRFRARLDDGVPEVRLERAVRR
jgi:hypothetical protein